MRHIKASEVREGMEVEWTSRGWHHRGEVATVKRNDHVGVWLQSSDGFEMSVEPDQAITVLSEPQPDEPTAFGACVEVAGERFVCTRPKHAYGWKKLGMGDSHIYSWYDITEHGHVTVINPDPFASAELREPRVWDRIVWKPVNAWEPSVTGEHDLNKFSPFTEVLDA